MTQLVSLEGVDILLNDHARAKHYRPAQFGNQASSLGHLIDLPQTARTFFGNLPYLSR